MNRVEIHVDPVKERKGTFDEIEGQRRGLPIDERCGAIGRFECSDRNGALLKKYPALFSTVVDIENVCIAGREIAKEQGLSDRLSYFSAEFSKGELPSGYDLVLQCDVGAFGVDLFQKSGRALKPGRRLVLVEHFSPTENHAPPTLVEWTFLDSLRDPNFIFPTLDQVGAQLVQAGFDVSPDHRTFRNGWTILQASRK